MLALIAGGDVNLGQVLDASEEERFGPADAGILPDDLAVSLYQNLGIDPRME